MVKIKEVQVTANYAWSPQENYPVYLAAGTAAQQLDATFSSNAKLELYAIDMADTAMMAKSCGKVETSNRFHKVVWGGDTDTDASLDDGVVVCGNDKGGIEIYNPKKIISGEDDCLVLTTSKHTGPVRALDFNKFQKNLFASGASDSEIFIWDLKNPTNPMTPGKKTQPTSAISAVAWNQQVQHILASTSTLTSGPSCVVWDLRKNEPIIKVQDPAGRMQCIDVAWHPDVATQLVLASEDDHCPVVQLWDLRFATSPMKVLEKHTQGVVSVAWCPRDPDLLLTCAKDNQVLCWNPNSSPPEVLHELETHAQWCFDVQWCPRNPNVISTGSFDGHISIHSLMGGGMATERETLDDKQRNAVAEAFGSMGVSSQQAAPAKQVKVSVPLKKPPKWMRKPCGATFVFGGKLVMFEDVQPKEPQQNNNIQRTVTIKQVVTQNGLVESSKQLREALVNDNQCLEFCKKKIHEAKNEIEEDFWNFIKVNFQPDARQHYLHLLGYNPEELKNKFNAVIGTKSLNGDLSSQVDKMTLGAKGEPGSTGTCLSESASSNSLDAFDQIATSKEQSDEKLEEDTKSMYIPVVDGDLDSQISQALLIGDYSAAVDLCLHGERMADAIIVAIAGGPTLLAKTQKRYFESSKSKISKLLSSVVTKDWKSIVRTCELGNWKEAFASLLTYATNDELILCCDELGGRLETSDELKAHACLCYVCSGNINKFVRCWNTLQPRSETKDESIAAIQNLVEKLLVLLRIVESRNPGQSLSALGATASAKLAKYAETLAAQGQLSAAIEVLPNVSEEKSIQILRDRLFHSQGNNVVGQQAPPFPFLREGCGFGNRPEAQVQPQPHLAGGYRQQTTSQVTTMMQPNQPQASYAPSSIKQQLPVTGVQRNPYASAQPLQRPSFSGPVRQQTPGNMFTPQPTATFPPQRAPQPATSMYQPYAPTPMSNSAPMMQPPPESSPMPPSPTDSYGQALKHNVGGWNDPPALDPNRIPRKKKTTPQPFVPNSYNLMTPSQPAQLPPAPMHMGQPMNTGMLPMNPSGPPGAMMGVHNPQLPPQSGLNPASNMMQNLQATVYTEETDDPDFEQNPPSHPSVPTGAMKDVPKAPIPTEHQILQTQFEELIKKCQNQASNAQMKRKLEECIRRLEFLYDKLRANKLSPNVTSGLHQMAQCIASRDYAGGIQCHTQIVSRSNFSEISAFMPGLKSMLQIAGQLRI